MMRVRTRTIPWLHVVAVGLALALCQEAVPQTPGPTDCVPRVAFHNTCYAKILESAIPPRVCPSCSGNPGYHSNHSCQIEGTGAGNIVYTHETNVFAAPNESGPLRRHVASPCGIKVECTVIPNEYCPGTGRPLCDEKRTTQWTWHVVAC